MDLSLRHIIVPGGRPYYRFSNADGKVWLMPARNMRTAMNLYQPSGRNGKLVKALFPLLHNIPFVRKAIHAEVLHCDLTDDLKRLLGRAFHEENPEFSIFCGTPCIHQKITMQISKGDRILGYCKTTESPEIADLFYHEARILTELAQKGVTGVPECLFCGELPDGATLFVQSTVKSGRAGVPHRWSTLHENFLQTLHRNTRRTLSFEESDYYRTLIGLKEHIDWLPETVDRQSVARAADRAIDRYRGRTMDFSAYHADFTPWNMFVEKGSLFVFDWEYARSTYPPLLDRYHFFTQTAIFERRWSTEDIETYLRTSGAGWIDREAYRLYLLDVIARFTTRERGNARGDIARSLKIWSDLLKYLNS